MMAGADENSGSDRETESDRPTEMGGLDGELQGAGRGNRAYGVGVQLTLFPTEDEQIKIIDEAESEMPFAFSISDTDLKIFCVSARTQAMPV